MNSHRKAANDDLSSGGTAPVSARSPRLLEWLTRLTQQGFSLDTLTHPLNLKDKTSATPAGETPPLDDWQAVGHICGIAPQDLVRSGAPLPLTAAEIDYFRRNHRGTETHISRDFLTAQTDLPSPLAELYGLYRHRARLDAEATLFLAQSSGSTRVAGVMGDLLAIGAFANGLEYVSSLGVTYSVPAAFDASLEIDRANQEAKRRLDLPFDHPAHLLKATPDELGILAASIASKGALQPADFLEKANLLAEARQDVTRLPCALHFATALMEHDLPLQYAWVARLTNAYARLFPQWTTGAAETDHAVH